MVEELEVIRSQIQRFLHKNLDGCGLSVEEFQTTDWVGSLNQLVTQTDYRTPSVIERATNYLKSLGKKKEAKEFNALVVSSVASIPQLEQKVKATSKPEYIQKANGSTLFAGMNSSEWDAVYDLMEKMQAVCNLCDEYQGYSQHVQSFEEFERDPEKQRLLEAWNAEDPLITWDEFAFEQTGEKNRGDAMRQKLRTYAKKTGQYCRKGDPGRK